MCLLIEGLRATIRAKFSLLLQNLISAPATWENGEQLATIYFFTTQKF
jgi:hypothetical protein